MTLLSPEIALIIWSLIFFSILALIAVALVPLFKSDRMDDITKLIWVAIIFFVPIVGPILFLIKIKKEKKSLK